MYKNCAYAGALPFYSLSINSSALPEFASRLTELQEIMFYDQSPQTGSIFIEDPSFAFDYAHILPLVKKCSILHGRRQLDGKIDDVRIFGIELTAAQVSTLSGN